MSGMGLLFDLLTVVVTAVPGYLSDAGLEQFPEYYITPGKPAYDCPEGVIVWATRYGQSAKNIPNINGGRVVNVTTPAAMITVHVLECVPQITDTGIVPSLSAYAEASQRIYNRAECIYNGFMCDITRRTLWEGTVAAQPTVETAQGELIWDAPSGGTMAGHFTITTQLQ